MTATGFALFLTTLFSLSYSLSFHSEPKIEYIKRTNNQTVVCYIYEEELNEIPIKELNDNPLCNEFSPYYKTSSGFDCHHYRECYLGKLTTRKCPWLQKFNPSLSKCSLGRSNCDGVLAPFPAQWPSLDCKGRPDFKTTSPWGCRYYLECRRGRLSVGKCPGVFPKFQETTQRCRNLFIKCNNRPFLIPSATTTPSPPYATAQTTTEETPTLKTTEEAPTLKTTEETTTQKATEETWIDPWDRPLFRRTTDGTSHS